jgi:hypothetical protein
MHDALEERSPSDDGEVVDCMESVDAADPRLASGVRFSICTLVTDFRQYQAMMRSFARGGFRGSDCEYIHIDNSVTNSTDAYRGLNRFLHAARGDYVILCHQDVELIADDRLKLESVIGELEDYDPSWALAGNSGGMAPGRLAIRISDPHGSDQRTEQLPARVHSLDENFIVVKRCANLSLSRDLSGFHLYGTDICIVAEILGWSAYVVDFHLLHRGAGRRDRTLSESRAALVSKYARAFRARWVATPCEVFFLSGSERLASLLSSRLPVRIAYHLGRVLRNRSYAQRT